MNGSTAMKNAIQVKLYGDPGDYLCRCDYCDEHFHGKKLDRTCPRCEVLFPVGARELRGCLPVVLYFPTDKDREEFIAMVKHAKPNLETRKLE